MFEALRTRLAGRFRGPRARLTFLATAIAVAAVLPALSAPLAAQASGPWTVSSTPNQGTSANVLNGVSCVSTTSCVAVGYDINSTAQEETLAEKWDGSSWTLIPPLNPGGFDQLTDVSCVSSTFCMAVGFSDVNSQQTLAETWNGTTWVVLATLNPGTATSNDNLTSVSCVSATSCMAVGYTTASGGNSQTLTEMWDGTTWTVPSSPNQGTLGNFLAGVSCVTTNSCVAVGAYAYSASFNHDRSLAETWNGTAWTISLPPNANTDNVLEGVACTGAISCVAVGHQDDGTTFQTLADTWDGTAWTATTPTNASASFSVLARVACASNTSCLAVGSASANSTGLAAAQTWDGNAWTSSSPAPSSTAFDLFNGASCPSAGFCAAVGEHYTSSGNSGRTLAEFYQAAVTTPSTTPTPSASPTSSGTPVPDAGAVSSNGLNPVMTGAALAGAGLLLLGLLTVVRRTRQDIV